MRSYEGLRLLSKEDKTEVANPPALYRGQNPEVRKKGFQGRKKPIPTTQKKGGLSQKIPVSLQGTTEKWGFSNSNRLFQAVGNEGFRARNPLFPILGILTHVQGRWGGR